MRRSLGRLAGLVAFAALVGGCARVGIPPGKEMVEERMPPRIAKVHPLDANHVEVIFDEAMDAQKLRDPKNYVLTDETGRVLPLAAVVVTRENGVTLVTETQAAGKAYEVTIRNVADAAAGNRIQGGNTARFRASARPDDRPPAVAAVFPAEGATGVGVCPEVVVEYTDAMAPAAADVVAVYDDFGAAVPGAARGGGQRYRWRPDAKLDYATTYTVVMRDTVADVAGNRLYRERRANFTTVEDSAEVIITGAARVKEEGLSPAGVEVRVSLSPDPVDEAAHDVAYATTDEEGKFVLAGVPPNTEAAPTYYLVAVMDEDGDGEPERWGGYAFVDGKAGALPAFVGGERLENVEVVLSRADTEGPECTGALLEPAPTGGQPAVYVRATFTDAAASAITAAEVFFDDAWSDGTGFALQPAVGEWGAGPTATAEGVVLDLARRGAKRRGAHVAYFHAKDAAGNWGKFYALPFDVTGAPPRARAAGGEVEFDLAPAAKALVTAAREGGGKAAFTRTDKEGRFTLKGLPGGTYALTATLDEDGDERWRPGEPSGSLAGVDLTARDAAALKITLTYGPALADANARLQLYGAGPAMTPKAVLTVSVAASDRAGDLERVWATLPGGEEVPLTDDGVPPDAAAADGVYTYSRVYEGDDVAAVPAGEVTIYAEDARGERAAADAEAYPGLRLIPLTPPTGLNVKVDGAAELVTASWDPVAGAEGGYVVFVIPGDRLERFTEPGSAEIFSNFANPVFDPRIVIPFAALTDWWAYPARSRFVLMVVASAGDGRTFQISDKSLVTAEWLKPLASGPAAAGTSGGPAAPTPREGPTRPRR